MRESAEHDPASISVGEAPRRPCEGERDGDVPEFLGDPHLAQVRDITVGPGERPAPIDSPGVDATGHRYGASPDADDAGWPRVGTKFVTKLAKSP
ncbi:hypothetical protein ACN28S_02850 [Cystobacter fuscus]